MLQAVFVCEITLDQLRDDAHLLCARNFLEAGVAVDEYRFKSEQICTVCCCSTCCANRLGVA
jgi:hypothetical protein